ncbi:MAG: DUF4349 domain-containing protein [Candidatus Omnitrophica bacterium]|nr:DUF4349 domain-containing protein [Candidatus Omnitrophota bacterium]
MNDSSLRTINSFLSRYIDGELSPDEKKFVEAHLHANQKLQNTVEALQTISTLLKESFSEIESMDAAAARLGNFIIRLPKQVRQKPKRWRLDWSLFFSTHRRRQLAGIAVFVILAVLITPTMILPHLQTAQTDSMKSVVAGDSIQLGRRASTIVQEKGTQRRGVAAKQTERFGTYGFGMGGMGMGMPGNSDTVLYFEGAPVSPHDKSPAPKQFAAGLIAQNAGREIVGEKYISTDKKSGAQPEKSSDQAFEQPDARKIIRNADMLVEVEQLADAQSAVERIVSEAGGLTAQLTLREKEKPPWAQYTLWIPAERLDAVLEECKKLGEVQHLESAIQDITEQYFDQETRIRNLQRQEERLLKLFERDAVKMEELLKVEQEIARVRTEIEQMQGRQRLWDRQIQFSTLTLNLRQIPEEKPIAESKPKDVFTPLRRAFQDAVAVMMYSLSLMTKLLSWIFSFAVFAVPWIAIILIGWYVGKRFLRQ